ncbi:MAG: hypothetical protein ACFB16_17070 [Phormidesmis sp.]
MRISPATNSVSRVKINALFSAEEAEALQRLLEKLTEEDCRKLADSDDEASAFAQAANKMRRQLNAAEELPPLPDFDD